jgi:hypothetical protein
LQSRQATKSVSHSFPPFRTVLIGWEIDQAFRTELFNFLTAVFKMKMKANFIKLLGHNLRRYQHIALRFD